MSRRNADAYTRALTFSRDLVSRVETSTPFGPVLLPAPGFYTGIFAWDSAWHYFFLKELSGERAVLGSTYTPEGRSYLLDPPVYGWAAADAVLSGLVTGARADQLLKHAVAALAAFRDERRLGDLRYPFSELPVILHPLESGTDASPQFDEIYRGLPGLLTAMVRLPRRLAALRWDPAMAVAAGMPAVFDITVISFYLLGLAKLEEATKAHFASHATGSSDSLPSGAELARLVEAAGEAFFDRDREIFTTRWIPARATRGDRRAKRIIACTTATLGGVLPLMVPGMVPEARTRSIVTRHLLPGSTFFAHHLSRYTVPPAGGTRRRERLSRLLWRGPCSWMNMNYCVSLILHASGYESEAFDLAERALSAVEHTGPHEFLHSDGRSGGGPMPFSWNGLVLPMIRAAHSESAE